MEKQVCVASYVNSSEAELAKVLLAQEGIPAFFENACLVLWKWYFSNAVGGVKVFVPESEAARAWSILHPTEERKTALSLSDELPSQEGTHAPDMTIATDVPDRNQSADAELIIPPAESEFPLKFSAPVVAAIICGSGLLLLISSGGFSPMLVFWAFLVVLILAMRSLWPSDESDSAILDDSLDQNETEEYDDEPDDYERIEATVGRAWKAAIFGLAFMPLTIYSFWVLIRFFFDEPALPLRPRETRRIYTAWTICLVELLVFLAMFICF